MAYFKFEWNPIILAVACLGACFSVLADVFSGYSPNVPINSFIVRIEDIKHFGIAKSLFQLEIGQYIAFISIPMSALAIIPLYQGIKKSKFKLLKLLFVISFSFSCFLGLAFHTLITVYSFIFIKEQQGQLILSAMDINFMSNLFNAVIIGSIASSIFSNACFIFIVFRSRTIFSRFSALLSPLFFTTALIFFSNQVPAPFASFFYIVSGNLGLLIWYMYLFKFYITKVEWNKVRNKGEILSTAKISKSLADKTAIGI